MADKAAEIKQLADEINVTKYQAQNIINTEKDILEMAPTADKNIVKEFVVNEYQHMTTTKIRCGELMDKIVLSNNGEEIREIAEKID